MDQKVTPDQIKALAASYGIEYAAAMAFITVESSGVGFNPPTRKLIIRFEPAWFKKLSKLAWLHSCEPWNVLPAGNQYVQWQMFNNAYGIDPIAAMESTSIGMMQIMSFHFRELGFKAVGEMWDFAKVNEANQVELGLKFIKSMPSLYAALQAKDWSRVAYYYNGARYRENNYDKKLLIAYNKYK